MKGRLKIQTRLPKINRPIDYVVVHCSETKATDDLRACDLNDMALRRGYSGIQYHIVVGRDGKVEMGRDFSKWGIACSSPNMDYISIALCYVGGKDDEGNMADTRTPEQKVALRAVLTTLKSIWPNAAITGHSNHDSVECPGFDAKSEYADITGEVYDV